MAYDFSEEQVTLGLRFTYDQKELAAIQKALYELKKNGNINLFSKEQQAAIEQWSKNIAQGYNTFAGITNLNKTIGTSLKSSVQLTGDILRNMNGMKDVTPTLSKGINLFNQGLSKSLLEIKTTKSILDKFGETLFNSAKWTVATNGVMLVLNNVKKIAGYTTQIDKSLNNIRIVTKQSGDYMSSFLRSANSAAQKLATTTNEYAKASLIFFQQGLNEEEVNKRTNTVIKAANVTKQAVSDVSEELTALWNGFQINQDQLEASVDKLAAVAANSASSLSEITTAISKTASIAKTLGVDLDQLNAQIATIISTTRQAPEQVGTALRTIYARMMDLAVDGTDEFGVSLGTVSSQLKEVGVDILTSTGQIKDLGGVIEDVASKWNLWTSAQKQAVAIAVAGKRQYNNLFALFENWDKYQNNLTISKNSLGELQKQQNIFLESYEAKINKLQSSWEALIDNFRADGMFKAFLDGANGLVKALGAMTKSPFGKTMGLLGLTANLAGFVRKPLTEQVQTISYNAMMRRENEYNRQVNISGVKQYNSTASIIDDYSRLTSAEGMRSIIDEIYSQANQKINEKISTTFSSEVALKKQQELETRKNEMLEKMEPLLQNMESAMNFIKDFFITYKKSNPEGYKQLFDKYADGDGESFLNEWTAATNKKILQDTVEGKSSGLSYTEQLSHFMFNNKSMLNKIISNSELQAELLKQINDGIRSEERVKKVGIAQEIIDEEGNIIKKVPGKAKGGTLDNRGINLAPIDRSVLNPGDPDRYLVQARVADGEVLSVVPKKDVKNSRQAGYLVKNGMLEYKDIPGYNKGTNNKLSQKELAVIEKNILYNLSFGVREKKGQSDEIYKSWESHHYGKFKEIAPRIYGPKQSYIKYYNNLVDYIQNQMVLDKDSENKRHLYLNILRDKPIVLSQMGNTAIRLTKDKLRFGGSGTLLFDVDDLKQHNYTSAIHEIEHIVQSIFGYKYTTENYVKNHLSKKDLTNILKKNNYRYTNQKDAYEIINKDILLPVLEKIEQEYGLTDKISRKELHGTVRDFLSLENKINTTFLDDPIHGKWTGHDKKKYLDSNHIRYDEFSSDMASYKQTNPRLYEGILKAMDYFIPGFSQKIRLMSSKEMDLVNQVYSYSNKLPRFATGGLMDNKGNIVRGDGVYDNGNIVLSTIPNGVLNPGDPDRYLLQARVADGEAIQVIPKDRIQKLPGYAAGNAVYTDSYATAVLEILKKFVKQLDNLYVKSDLTNKQLAKIEEKTTKVGQAKDILMTFVKNNNDIKTLNKLWEKEEKKNKQYLTEATQINKEQKQRIKKENTDIKQQEQRMEKFNNIYDYTELFGQASNVAAGFQNLGEIVGTLVSGSGSFSELIPKIAALGATIKWVTNFVKTSPVMKSLVDKIPAFKEAGDILTGNFDPRAKLTEKLIKKGILEGDPNSSVNKTHITKLLNGSEKTVNGEKINPNWLKGVGNGLFSQGGALLAGGAALGVGIIATAAYDKIQEANYKRINEQTKVLNTQNETLKQTITQVNKLNAEYKKGALSSIDFKAQLSKAVDGIKDVSVKLAALNGDIAGVRGALLSRMKEQAQVSAEGARDYATIGYAQTNIFKDIGNTIGRQFAGTKGKEKYDYVAEAILNKYGLSVEGLFSAAVNSQDPNRIALIKMAYDEMKQDPNAMRSVIFKKLQQHIQAESKVFSEEGITASRSALNQGIMASINTSYMDQASFSISDIEKMVKNYNGTAPTSLIYQALLENFDSDLDEYQKSVIRTRAEMAGIVEKELGSLSPEQKSFLENLTDSQQQFLLYTKHIVNWSNNLNDEFKKLAENSLAKTYQLIQKDKQLAYMASSPFAMSGSVSTKDRIEYLKQYMTSENVLTTNQAIKDLFGFNINLKDYLSMNSRDIAKNQLIREEKALFDRRELLLGARQEQLGYMIGDNGYAQWSQGTEAQRLRKQHEKDIENEWLVEKQEANDRMAISAYQYEGEGGILENTQNDVDKVNKKYEEIIENKLKEDFLNTVQISADNYFQKIKELHTKWANIYKQSVAEIKNLISIANTIETADLDVQENGLMTIENWMNILDILNSNDANKTALIDMSSGNVKLNEDFLKQQLKIEQANLLTSSIKSTDAGQFTANLQTTQQATNLLAGLDIIKANPAILDSSKTLEQMGKELAEALKEAYPQMSKDEIENTVNNLGLTKEQDDRYKMESLAMVLGFDPSLVMENDEKTVSLLSDIFTLLKDSDILKNRDHNGIRQEHDESKFINVNTNDLKQKTIDQTNAELVSTALLDEVRKGKKITPEVLEKIMITGSDGQSVSLKKHLKQTKKEGFTEKDWKEFIEIANTGNKQALDNHLAKALTGAFNRDVEVNLASKQAKASQANFLAHVDYYADISEKLRQINATISKIQTEMQHTRGASNYPNYKKLEDSFNKLATAQTENSIVAKSQIKTFGTLLQQNGIDISKGMVSAQLQIAAVSDQTRRQQLQEWYQQYHQGVQKDDEANKAWMDAKLQEAGAKLDSLVSQALAEIEYIEVKKGIDKFNWNMSQNKQYDVQWKDFSADMRGTVRDSRHEAEELYHNVDQVKSLYQEMSSIGKVVNGQFQIDNVAHFETAKDAFDRMQKAYQAAEQNVQNIFSNLQTAYNDMKTHISDTAAEFDYLQSKIDLSNNALSTMKSLIDSTQKAGLIYFGKVDTYYKGQEEVTKRQAQMFYEETRMWKEIYDAAEEGSELQNTAWQNYTSHLQQARAKVVELANTWKQDLAEGIESAARHFEDFVLMGQRFSFGQYMDDFQTGQANKYFDEIEQLGKINSLRFTIQNDIEQSDFSDRARKKILEFYDQEEEYLKNKKDMTESDVKLTQLKYELLKKQIALEDAQNAKNSMKLVRNAAGNWSYQYVADEQKKDDLANQLNDVHQQIQDLSTQEKQNAESNYLKLQQEFVQKMKEASLDDSLTENQRKEQMDAYTTKYQILLEQAAKEAGRWGSVLATNTSDWAKDLNLWTDGKTYDLMSPEIQALVNGTGNGNAETFNETEQLMKDNFDNIADYADEVLARSLDTWDGYAHRIVEMWADDNGDSVKSQMQKAYDEMLEKLKEYSRGIEEVQRISDISFNSEEGIITTTYNAVNATNGLLDATKDLANESVDTLNSYLNTIEKLDAAWRRSLNSVQNMQPIIKNMSEAIAHQVELLPELVTNANDLIVAQMLEGWKAVINAVKGMVINKEDAYGLGGEESTEVEDKQSLYHYYGYDSRSKSNKKQYHLLDNLGNWYGAGDDLESAERISKNLKRELKGSYIAYTQKHSSLNKNKEEVATTTTATNSSTTSNTTTGTAFNTVDVTKFNTTVSNLNTVGTNLNNTLATIPAITNETKAHLITSSEENQAAILNMVNTSLEAQGLANENTNQLVADIMQQYLINSEDAALEALALLNGGIQDQTQILAQLAVNIVQQVATSIPDVWKNSGQELQEKRSSATINGQSYNGHLSNTGRALYTDEGYIIHFGNSANGGPGAFDTGGYTGDWSGDLGKLAILHKKEQIFNADDTALLHSAAKYLNDNSDLKNRLKSYTTNNSSNYDIDKESLSNPTYNITANFPNADDMQSIKNALLSLPNIVSQHITQIKTGKEY